MKKILFTALFASAMLGASAENSIGFVPTKVAAGANNNWVQISLSNEINLCSVAFDIHLPLGFSFYSEATIAQVPTNGSIARAYNEDDDEPYSLSSMYNMQVGADGHNFARVVKGGTVNIKGNNGPLFRTRLVVDAGVAPGVYPVTFTNFSYNGEATATERWKHEDKVFTSYVIVGEPSNESLKVVGEIPSFVNTALATASAITNLDLSAATASYGTFTYVDGRDVVAPTADFTATAAYSKAVASGKYASLTMPFDADLTDKGAYVLGSVSGTTANFIEATNVNAGDVVLLTKDVNLEGTKLGAATKSVKSDVYYVSPDGTELHKGTNVTIPALRGYWNVGGGASNLRIALDGVLTDINLIDVQGEGAQAFDLQGRQVQNAKNGVFVVNGKKQFVK